MGYWSTIPMGGDLPQDMKDEFGEELVNKFGDEEIKNKMNTYSNQNLEVGKAYNLNDIDISAYEDFIEHFEIWSRDYISSHEDEILKYIKRKIRFGYSDLSKNQVNYIIPLSFLEWKIKLNKESKLSKYLLKLLSDTDGGNDYRGYEEKDNMYPNKLYSPYDFIKYYINNWNVLIKGQIDYDKIDSNVDIVPNIGNLMNVK